MLCACFIFVIESVAYLNWKLWKTGMCLSSARHLFSLAYKHSRRGADLPEINCKTRRGN